MTKGDLRKEILDRFAHFYKQTSGLLLFPDTCEGDLLRMCNLYFNMPEPDMDLIRDARDAIAKAHDVPCTCTGFMLQYNQGCSCKKHDAIDSALKHFWSMIACL